MKIYSGDASFHQSRTYGRFIQTLLDAPDYWIRRRIDDVSSPSHTELVRRISFDVHISRVIRLARKYRVPISSQILLPLLILPREILAGVDIIGPDGQSLHLLKRSENSFLAEAAVKSTMGIWDALWASSYADYFRSTTGPESARPPVQADDSRVRIGDFDYIFAVALPLDKQTIEAALRGEDRLSLIKVSLRSTSATRDLIATRWKGPSIVPKATFDYPLDSHPDGPYHQVRVDIPDGLQVVSAEFRTVLGKRCYPDAEDHKSIKITAGQVVANARHERNALLAQGNARLARQLGRLVVVCRLSGELVLPVVFALAFVALALFILDVLRFEIAALDSSSKAAVVALLLIAPALIGLYAARPTAHFKVRFAVNLYRSFLVFAALVLVTVAFMFVMLPAKMSPEPDGSKGSDSFELAIGNLGVVLTISIWVISGLSILILGAWLWTFVSWRRSSKSCSPASTS